MKLLIALSGIVLLISACGTKPLQQHVGQHDKVVGRIIATDLYQCGAEQIVTSNSDQEELLLEKLKQAYVLKRTISASGAKYTGSAGNKELVFWTKGDTAFLEEEGQSVDCRKTANLFPVQIRGNEPGWHVSFDQDVTRINLQYGKTKINLPRAVIDRDGKQWRYTASDSTQLLKAQLENKLCVDDMSGMTFPIKATITMGEETYSGCGGTSALVLSGGDWIVTHIGGVPVQGNVTLGFNTSDQFSGSSGCNRFASTYNLSGEGMRIGRMATTRMACAPALMQQEARFIKLLETVDQFEIPKQGELLLHGENDQEIKAHR